MRGPRVAQGLLTRFRHVLHKYPELSGEEGETARRVQGFLNTYRPTKVIEGIGGNGLAAVYHYTDSPTILVRCELDALPIPEVNDFEHRSTNPGVAHKCGHDGHMAIVAGLAAIFGRKRPKKGRVVLLFQPAEENGEGARAVLNDERFKEIEPDHVIALHNLPGYPMHKVVCRPGTFTPTVRSIIIRLKGKTAHAGEPEHGSNPAMAIAGIIKQFGKLPKPMESKAFTQVTPVHINMGEIAYGTSAGEGELHFTVRTWDKAHMEKLVAKMEMIIRKEATVAGLGVDIEYTQFFNSNVNDAHMVEHIKQAALSTGLEYEERATPFTWGEDFGLFTEQFNGAMFGLGAGEDTPALHNPDYDFPDELITSGVNMFRAIIYQLLEE